MRLFRILVIGALCGTAACSTTEVMIAHSVDLVEPKEVVPEDQLLDVGISVFDPGVPEGEIPKDALEELIREGTFVHIRRMESMYMAVELQKTLQNSGYWGGVWVMPEPSNAADVNVTATILHSDGDIARVEAKAVDALGRVWIDDTYELETPAGVYNRQRYPDLDPYQDLFNMIANDLAAAQAALSEDQRSRIRTVAALRYAEELSPEAFAGYIEERRDGTYQLNRLPAEGDPMFARTERVRARERLFVETLGQHYAGFARDAEDSYHGWREYAREEAISIRELTKSARWRTGLGIATIVASVVYGSNAGNDSFSDRVLRDALMYMGMDVLQTGAVRRQEKRLHTEALEELSLSFEDEVQPLIVEIQGTEHRLTGTAEAQYHEWRDLLQQLFVSETGFAAEDVQIYVEPEPLVPGIEPEPEAGSAEDPGAPADGAEASEPASGSAEPPEANADGDEATGAEATDAGATDTGATDGDEASDGAEEESGAPTADESDGEARIASDAAAAPHGA